LINDNYKKLADRFRNEAADEWKEWRGIFQKRRKDKFLRYKEDRKKKRQESKNDDGPELTPSNNICGGQWFFVGKEKKTTPGDDDDDDDEWEVVEREIR